MRGERLALISEPETARHRSTSRAAPTMRTTCGATDKVLMTQITDTGG
jgi:hypothetical protein